MSTNEVHDEPTAAVESEFMGVPEEHAIPKEKSGVAVDPSAIMNTPTPRFQQGAEVHMSETRGATRIKGSYTIYRSRYSRSRGYTEYQLRMPNSKALYKDGEWFREKDLRRGS